MKNFDWKITEEYRMCSLIDKWLIISITTMVVSGILGLFVGYEYGKEAGRAELTRELEGGREIITTNRIIIGRVW